MLCADTQILHTSSSSLLYVNITTSLYFSTSVNKFAHVFVYICKSAYFPVVMSPCSSLVSFLQIHTLYYIYNVCIFIFIYKYMIVNMYTYTYTFSNYRFSQLLTTSIAEEADKWIAGRTRAKILQINFY